jgi:hypothetical protein
METKYLRLRTPVELGSRFDDWQVCWLGGWSKHRLDYLVMLVKVPFTVPFADRPVSNQTPEERSVNGKRRREGARRREGGRIGEVSLRRSKCARRLRLWRT